MKKIAFLAAVAATVCTVACNKKMDTQINEVPDPAQEVERYELKVGLRSSLIQTKASENPNDDLVKSFQVLVFNGDMLDAFAYKEDPETLGPDYDLTLSCTAGEREVYAVVNAPSLASVTSKTAFLATKSLRSQNYSDKWQMIGHDTVTLPQTDEIIIDVHRIGAKVKLDRITRAFTVSGLADLTFKVDAIYISNAAGDINFGETEVPSFWINKQGVVDSGNPLYAMFGTGQKIIANNAYETFNQGFILYPNGADDSTATTWSPRHTRVVVKATVGTQVCYYPITLPVIESNKMYIISNLTVTRMGSSDPDQPVSIQDCTFDINIEDWTTVNVTDEGEDDITI